MPGEDSSLETKFTASPKKSRENEAGQTRHREGELGQQERGLLQPH
eukprot:CAMPEP_0168346044 /NCGR_PEP_ID=MMETSP0213-20121227/17994_1 /TAXON_ID=151035 /ORGANISM="Euplotes harpa, Strain FSP1.4" /LENGTH=45 /DNA_ID= /DNA_START= /DNA_END= /DNA_ORIENTATION=